MRDWRRWMAVVVMGLGLAWAAGWGVGRGSANAAPPETASGTGPAPASASTQVRMEAETVVLTVSPDGLQAQVTGEYLMRNMGAQTETLGVRFPLGYVTGLGNVTECPEIRGLQVWVDDQAVTWQRISGTPTAACPGDRAPWAEFQVTFPPQQPVRLRVSYTQDAWGYAPYRVLSYIVETGAGWYGTIGQGEIRVEMPYEVSPGNVVLEGGVGFGFTSPHAQLQGRTVRWQFQDLEPGPQDNFFLLYVEPEVWQAVEQRRAAVQANPQDGDAWGFLGLALKRVLQVPGLWDMSRTLRHDPGARALLDEALQAYAQAVALRPDDPDWHFGYAELLVAAAVTWGEDDPQQAHAYKAQATAELAQALALDPQHAKTRAFLEDYAFLLEGWVEVRDGQVVFVGLTATPPAPAGRAPPASGESEATAAPPLGSSPAEPGGVPTAGPAPATPLSPAGAAPATVPAASGNTVVAEDGAVAAWVGLVALMALCGGGALVVAVGLAVWFGRRAR